MEGKQNVAGNVGGNFEREEVLELLVANHDWQSFGPTPKASKSLGEGHVS